MRCFYLSLFCLCALLPWQSVNGHEHHVHYARQYVGQRESNGANRSDVIDRWNRAVSVPPGSPYCAAFVSAVLTDVRCTAITTRSARARAFIAERRGLVLDVHAQTRAEVGDILVFKRNGGGHIAIVERVEGNVVYTVEANTSPGRGGSQWNGDGVWRRKRTLYEPWSAFRITHIVRRRP
jgi:hypothetical protein